MPWNPVCHKVRRADLTNPAQLPQHLKEDKSPQVGIFGPLVAHPTTKDEEDGPAPKVAEPATIGNAPTATQEPASLGPPPPTADDAEVSRKRPQQHVPNGSPVKRPRLSNGLENGIESNGGSIPMDVDQQDQQQDNAYPSPLDGEDAATPAVHTEGPEQGTQLEKVEELTPHTTFIRLTDDADNGVTESQPAASPAPGTSADAANAPTLLNCQWNPRDPSVLAASGTGALARIWTVSRVTVSDSETPQDHVSPSGLPLLEPETSLNTVVSQLAWTSDGSSLAVVAQSEGQASINVYASDGGLLQSFDSPAEQVIKLCWNPSNTALLAISPTPGPEELGALVTVYYASGGASLSYSFVGHDLAAAPLDASWTSDAEFLVCGGDMLASLYCADSSVVQVRKFETKSEDSFRSVLFDWRSKLAATGSEKGTLDVG